MLDHLVYATSTLAATVAALAEQGLATVPGGQHVGLGTRGTISPALGGGAYLEVIGPDPDQPEPAAPRPFGVDHLDAPALVAWCVRPSTPLDDAAAAARGLGFDPGPIVDMSRRRPDGVLLAWRLTISPAPTGALPFLIDWGTSPHPAASLPGDAELTEFVVADPDPDHVAAVLRAIGEPAGLPSVVAGPTSLRAVVRVADGRLVTL